MTLKFANLCLILQYLTLQCIEIITFGKSLTRKSTIEMLSGQRRPLSELVAKKYKTYFQFSLL